MNYIHSAPLAATLEGLQQGQHSLSIYLEQMCRRIDQIDPNVHAFLTESNRLGRLRGEIGLLRERFPDRIDLPALFGAMVGVKDIFHVDGFATHAGSELPAEAFAGPEAK